MATAAAPAPPVPCGARAGPGPGSNADAETHKQRLDEFVKGIRGFERHAEALTAVMASAAWEITCLETLTALPKDAVLRLLGEIQMGEGPKAVFVAAWKATQCAAPHSADPAVDSATRALILKLQAGLRAAPAAGWDAKRFAEAFRANQNSVQMIRRSAVSLIQSPGAAQKRIVELHCAGLLECNKLFERIKAFRNDALRLDRGARQAVVLTLLQGDAIHDAPHAEKLSFLAVALTFALLGDHADAAVMYLRDDAAVCFHRWGTVLSDDYHRAFCAIVIGSACQLTSAPAVQFALQAMCQ
jgi:hypothetical protein